MYLRQLALFLEGGVGIAILFCHVARLMVLLRIAFTGLAAGRGTTLCLPYRLMNSAKWFP
jgi:hypothetical protein